jgi:hypothetical protein
MKIAKFYRMLLLIFIVLGVYYPALFAPFCSIDDDRMITWLLNLEEIKLVDIFIPQDSGYYYRPLLSIMYLLDKNVWDLQPSFMHLFNIILHVINTILVYIIAERLAALKKIEFQFFPFSAALLFALHPINTESVLWISGRTDLLSALFILFAFLVLLFAQQRQSNLLTILAAFLFFVSTLAKDSAIFWYPGIMLYLYCITLYKKDKSSYVSTAIPFLSFSLVPLAYFLIRRIALSKSDTGISSAIQGISGNSVDLIDKLRIILKTLGFYLKKIIWPFPLNFTIVSISDWYIIIGVALIILSIYLFYRRNIVSSLYLMGIFLVLPALLVPLGKMAWTPLAERYLYMSASFFSIGVSMYICMNYQRIVVKPFFTSLLTLGYVGIGNACYERAVIWQDNVTLFQDSVNKSPMFAPARNDLAMALQSKGRNEEARKLFLSDSLPNEDKYSIVTDLNKATILAANKDVEGAIRLLKDKNYDSTKPMYKEYLEIMLGLNGKLDVSKLDVKKITEIKKENIDYLIKLQAFTGDPLYYYRLGQISLVDGNRSEARRFFMLAANYAKPNAFYRAAAVKLAEKLAR